jgi:hypothetical protein
MALDRRVLLLNQTYEPLGTVSVARAVVMTFKDSVTVEQYDGKRVLRSARAEFPVPSVIRRRTYINVRKRREVSAMKRLRVYIHDMRVVLFEYAEARAEWRKYLFMDVYDDRDVRDKVARERRR